MNKKNMNTLVCKGFGNRDVNQVPNNRLEINFRNKQGDIVELELFGRKKNGQDEKLGIYQRYELGDGIGIVVDCQINREKINICFGNYPYTEVGIIKMINQMFGMDFNAIAIQNQMPFDVPVKLNGILCGGMYVEDVLIRL